MSQHAWRSRALCAGDDLSTYFPEGLGADWRTPKKVCAACPVAAECLAFALASDTRDGVFGGLSPKQRAQLRRKAARA